MEPLRHSNCMKQPPTLRVVLLLSPDLGLNASDFVTRRTTKIVALPIASDNMTVSLGLSVPDLVSFCCLRFHFLHKRGYPILDLDNGYRLSRLTLSGGIGDRSGDGLKALGLGEGIADRLRLS